MNFGTRWRRRKAGEKGSNGSAVTEIKGKVKWQQNLERCLVDFG